MEENIPVFLKEFLDYKSVIQNLSNGTIKEYKYDLIHFLKYISYIKSKKSSHIDDEEVKKEEIADMDKSILKKIDLMDMHSFLMHVKKECNNSSYGISRKASAIRSFFKYFTTVQKYLEENPASNLETPKIPKTLPKYLGLEEAKKLLNATLISDDKSKKYMSRNHLIITMFLNCGIRLNELININISDINFDDNKLVVTGKGSKERTVYLNNAVMKALNNYLLERPKNVPEKYKDALFLSNQNKRISRRSVQYITQKELAKAGLDITKYSPHKLRHTAATLMYQYGAVDITALQKVLGHESISTTEIYTHAENYEIKRAVENNPLGNL